MVGTVHFHGFPNEIYYQQTIYAVKYIWINLDYIVWAYIVNQQIITRQTSVMSKQIGAAGL